MKLIKNIIRTLKEQFGFVDYCLICGTKLEPHDHPYMYKRACPNRCAWKAIGK